MRFETVFEVGETELLLNNGLFVGTDKI